MAAFLLIFTGIILVFVFLMLITMWKIYAKAGKPGWACLIPIYNYVVWLEIVGKPTWWVILLLIPIVNIVVGIMLVHQLSLAFGKDVGFTLGLIFLPFIFFPMLAFGSATYVRGAIIADSATSTILDANLTK